MVHDVSEIDRAEGSNGRSIRSAVVTAVERVLPLSSLFHSEGLSDAEVKALWKEYHKKLRDRRVEDFVSLRDF